MRKLVVLSTLVLGAITTPAYAVVYSTDFSSIASPSGGTLQGDGSIWGVGSISTGSPAATWSASAGNFDFVKSGNSGYTCVGASGGCIELGGSFTSPPSKVDFTLNLAAGSYAISFDYSRQLSNSGFDFQIDGFTVESFVVLGPPTAWATHTEAFTVGVNGPVMFSFKTAGLAPNVGSLIDNVSVVPEPGQWALLLAGLAAVGTVARRRRSTI